MSSVKHFIRDVLHFILPKNNLGDCIFTWIGFVRTNGYMPHIRHPRRFMEHMFAMKLSGELYDPLRQFSSDKYCLKQLVEWTLGKKYTTETYQLLRSEEEIDNFTPTKFPCVVKPTHGSGDVVILNSKDDPVDKAAIKRWFHSDLYRQYREGNYRYLKPAIIVEELIKDKSGGVSKDYKFYCIDGVPKFIQVDKDRIINHVRNYYNLDWQHMKITVEDCPTGPIEERPEALDEMLHVARTLSAYFRGYVRIDLFYTGSEIKVGELDHSSANCKMKPRPIEYDDRIGQLFTNPDMVMTPIEGLG